MEEPLGGTARVGKWRFTFLNREEFFEVRREVFGRDGYYVELEGRAPVIVDLGAHVGLATGYFKQLYPDSTIMAVEPNPVSAELLRRNINDNGWEGVSVIEAAVVGSGEKRVKLYLDDSDEHWFMSGSLKEGAWNGRQQTAGIWVDAVRLADILPGQVDLLKMDIEGAEEEVLLSLGARVRTITHLMVEFHPRSGNELAVILGYLEAHRFTVDLWQKGKKVEAGKVDGLTLIEAHRKS